MALVPTFSRYLRLGFRKDLLPDLAKVLSEAGLRQISQALGHYLKSGSSEVPNLWTEGTCTVAFAPPSDPTTGDIWLDLADFQVHVFVERPDEEWDRRMSGWAGISPVMRWQFEALAEVVRFEFADNEHVVLGMAGKAAADVFFLKRRFSAGMATAPAAGCLMNEAAAYAGWFGKQLLAEELLSVQAHLPPALCPSVLPAGHRLWGHGVEPNGIGWDLENIDHDPEELIGLSGVDFEPLETGENMLFSVWVPEDGQMRSSGLAFPCIMLLNVPTRPE